MSDDARQLALARVDDLVGVLKSAPDQSGLASFISDTEELRRSIVSFHIEAIRFRAFTLERRMAAASAIPPAAREIFADVKRALERAGFAIKSH